MLYGIFLFGSVGWSKLALSTIEHWLENGVEEFSADLLFSFSTNFLNKLDFLILARGALLTMFYSGAIPVILQLSENESFSAWGEVNFILQCNAFELSVAGLLDLNV